MDDGRERPNIPAELQDVSFFLLTGRFTTEGHLVCSHVCSRLLLEKLNVCSYLTRKYTFCFEKLNVCTFNLRLRVVSLMMLKALKIKLLFKKKWEENAAFVS